MVFNTGAASLMQSCLPLYHGSRKEPMDIRSHRMSGEFWMYRNQRCTRYSEDFRKMNAWKSTICSLTEETADTIKLQKKEWHSLICIKSNGRTTQGRLQRCSREVQPNEPYRVYEGIRCNCFKEFRKKKEKKQCSITMIILMTPEARMKKK